MKLNAGRLFLIVGCFCWLFPLMGVAQNYHALNGSKYAGVMGMHYNPASTLNSAYKLDLSIFSAQLSNANTMVAVKNFSLSNYDSATATLTEGKRNRYFHNTFDINLLNFSVWLGKKSCVAFGLRARSYNHSKTDNFLWIDSLNAVRQVLTYNYPNPKFDFFATHSGWIEADFNFSHQLIDDADYSLSGGVTVGLLKSISGGYVQMRSLNYLPVPNLPEKYYLANGEVTANHSANYDNMNGNHVTRSSIDSFFNNTKMGMSLSLGVEYIAKKTDIYGTEDDGYYKGDYDWKFGASIMDIGANKFQSSTGAFIAKQVNTQKFTDSMFYATETVKSLQQMKDSAANYFTNLQSIKEDFSVQLPTRLVVYYDKNFNNHWYISAMLNVNFYTTEPKGRFKTRELNMLTVTPRWERRALGLYFPMQYTTQGRFLVGAAVKLGPLLLGLHNLAWLGNKYTQMNGGGYLAFKMGVLPPKAKYKYGCPKPEIL